MHGFKRITQGGGPLVCALLVFSMAALWSAIVPLGEAPDEPEHFAYVNAVMEGHFPSLTMPTSREAFQPPLAYLEDAVAARPFSPPSPTHLKVNPAASLDPGAPLARAFKARFAHPPDQDYPWSGWVRLWHLLRVVSAAWLAFAAVMAFLAARRLFPRSPVLWPVIAAATALLPQEIFIGMTVSNDPATIGMAALAVWFAALMWRRAPSTRSALLGGMLAGWLMLTKLSLLPFALLLVSLPVFSRRRWDKSALSTLMALLIWSPWALRLWYQTGDPTGLRANMDLHPTLRPASHLTLGFWHAAFATTSASLWGRFGWMNIALLVPDGRATALLIALMSLGIVVGLIRPDRLVWTALAGVIIVTIGAWLQYLASVGGSAAQGRLLMACALPVALLSALPFAGPLERVPAWIGWLVVVVAVAVDSYLLFWLIGPAYW
ncbi:hypothetical protein [Nitrolancea hollandica]|uniref:Glycosyltransferase RgtA/B/C/D-like domain-containing protein n=1 Tax=Nitrolancea hollandica Lb TaxID=1129897 RepID=I4EFW7_9BACT|nr:hypothetical protein [Nitrolancea hollandica]CCF83579.1 membrane hypothetical protein [Nitrolancea hollandica Lb]